MEFGSKIKGVITFLGMCGFGYLSNHYLHLMIELNDLAKTAFPYTVADRIWLKYQACEWWFLFSVFAFFIFAYLFVDSVE